MQPLLLYEPHCHCCTSQFQSLHQPHCYSPLTAHLLSLHILNWHLVTQVNEIHKMSTEQRRAVPHLTLSCSGAGSVRWESPLDLEGPKLAQIIQNVQIEPCGLTVVSRELLECSCLVTLKSVKGGTGTPAEQQETMKRESIFHLRLISFS